jgi:hypothetical protein
MENLTEQSRLKAMIVCYQFYVTVELNVLYCMFVVKIIPSKELWAWLLLYSSLELQIVNIILFIGFTAAGWHWETVR